jgi:CheY-like chemotaxis protein
MDILINFLVAVKDLFIPLSVFILAVTNIKSIKNILDSLSDRIMNVKKIKIGNSEIEVGESIKQLDNKINDAVKYLVNNVPEIEESKKDTPEIFFNKRILWVDDFPVNNVMIAESLRADGFIVDNVLSTEEALRSYDKDKYCLIISDMGRIEGNDNKNDAGVELCNKIRNYDKNIPIIIYTTSKNANRYYNQINSFGASITSSGVELTNRIYKLANKERNNVS